MNRRDIELYFNKYSSGLDEIPDVGVDDVVTLPDFIEAVEELESTIKDACVRAADKWLGNNYGSQSLDMGEYEECLVAIKNTQVKL